MKSTPVSALFSMLGESLFRIGEKKHLSLMNCHSRKREAGAHADMLSRMHEAPETKKHQKCIEHHAVKFWSYYYPGEHPDIDQPLPDYLDKAFDESVRLHARTLEPELTKVIPSIDGVGRSEKEIFESWIKCITLAQAAFSKGDFPEAEFNFKLALEESESLTQKRSRKTALAAFGLAESLERQGRVEEADPYYGLALSIDEEILGDGVVSLEDEFYTIAKHFLDEGKFELVEKHINELLKRLQMSVGRNDPLTARCLNELGIVYCSQKQWERAEASFLRALDILGNIKPRQNRQLAAIHNNCASLYEASDRPEKAEEHYRKALEFLSAPPRNEEGESSEFSP